MPIIRRNNCVYATVGTYYSVWITVSYVGAYATVGTCYSVWITVWYAGAYAPAYQTVITKSRTNTVFSPDDGHIVGRNM